MGRCLVREAETMIRKCFVDVESTTLRTKEDWVEQGTDVLTR